MVDRFAKEDFLYDLSPSRIEKWMSIFYQTSEIVCNRDVNSVLEVGGGRNLNREICKYFGVEHQVCDVISDYNPDFFCNFLDFTPVEPFDLVCAFQMLEHNPLEDLPVLLKKMVKLSKKYVFISVPYNGAMFSINISFRIFGRARKLDWLFTTNLFATKKTDRKKLDERIKKYPEQRYDPHWWEVGRQELPKPKFRQLLKSCDLKITKEFHNRNFPYHLFYLCEIDK